ncbi:hypothetical protein GMI69_00710 [Eggerthellaceae bacterium zg-887]|uniref:nucleoside-triphosphatase n=1 Tax=Xiamenia xianingshaonis TaxID=2682776 RepID=UPI001408B807|nr:nucleoside-triphosphatase [Xiamenia xianingshaonis]NHM15197.1 hypothetical protein [Xiamenia xianingshaonis]
MLVLVTGDRQVGKTRWLERLVEACERQGMTCKGVVCPGVWQPDECGGLAKVGIEALLLPEHENIPFACKRGLSPEAPAPSHQADAAKLVWRIYDEAIERINKQFDDIAAQGLGERDLLVVDEIGVLELVFGKGFASALALLDAPVCKAGPGQAGGCCVGAHAAVIVRPELIEDAKKRFAPAWGEPCVMDIASADTRQGIESLIGAFCNSSELGGRN